MNLVKEYGEREESPEQRLKDKDKRRAAYHRFYTDMKWDMPRIIISALIAVSLVLINVLISSAVCMNKKANYLD